MLSNKPKWLIVTQSVPLIPTTLHSVVSVHFRAIVLCIICNVSAQKSPFLLNWTKKIFLIDQTFDLKRKKIVDSGIISTGV